MQMSWFLYAILQQEIGPEGCLLFRARRVSAVLGAAPSDVKAADAGPNRFSLLLLAILLALSWAPRNSLLKGTS